MTRKNRRAGGSKARRAIRQKSEINNVVTPGLEGGKFYCLFFFNSPLSILKQRLVIITISDYYEA